MIAAIFSNGNIIDADYTILSKSGYNMIIYDTNIQVLSTVWHSPYLNEYLYVLGVDYVIGRFN